MCDVLRVFNQFKLLPGLEINMIEFSPFMRNMQQKNISETLLKFKYYMKFKSAKFAGVDVEQLENEDSNNFLSIRWY